MSIFRLLLYLGPFLKEVFIQSSEEKRVWFSRMFVIFIVTVSANILYLRSIHRHNDELIAEMVAYKKDNEVLRLTIKQQETAINLYKDKTNGQAQHIEELEKEITLLHQNKPDKPVVHVKPIVTPKTQHSLSRPPDPKPSKQTKEIELKPQVSKPKHQNRLEDLYDE